MITLDLLRFKPFLKSKRENGKQLIFCPIRKRFLVLQPEELVRQLLLVYLMEEKKYPKSKIAVEKSLRINELEHRFDILIYDENNHPFLLVECKAPEINIEKSFSWMNILTDSTSARSEIKINRNPFEQAAQYNFLLQVPYLLITNGISTFLSKMNYENQSSEFLLEIPSAE
ncbi:MAG: type I restriction enzyme HsdR N-terminal domain-containing protein [Saprospiraceae bacterium]